MAALIMYMLLELRPGRVGLIMLNPSQKDTVNYSNNILPISNTVLKITVNSNYLSN